MSVGADTIPRVCISKSQDGSDDNIGRMVQERHIVVDNRISSSMIGEILVGKKKDLWMDQDTFHYFLVSSEFLSPIETLKSITLNGIQLYIPNDFFLNMFPFIQKLEIENLHKINWESFQPLLLKSLKVKNLGFSNFYDNFQCLTEKGVLLTICQFLLRVEFADNLIISVEGIFRGTKRPLAVPYY